MDNDLKTTVTGLITSVVAILTYYGFLPQELTVPVIAIGVVLFSYFTNKK